MIQNILWNLIPLYESLVTIKISLFYDTFPKTFNYSIWIFDTYILNYILDFERSDKCNGFTRMFIYFLFVDTFFVEKVLMSERTTQLSGNKYLIGGTLHLKLFNKTKRKKMLTASIRSTNFSTRGVIYYIYRPNK